MKTVCAAIPALLIAVSFVGGCASPTKSVSHRVPAETLLSLQHGIPRTEVDSRLGVRSQHEFTTKGQNQVIQCVSYRFKRGDRHYSRFFVFTNEMLAKICVPPQLEFEQVPGGWKGSPYERPKYGDPEVRMQSVLSTADLTGSNLIESMPRFPPQKGKQSMNVLPAFIILAPLLLISAGEYQYEARSLAQRFDPQRVKIGATIKEVESVFGVAVLIEPREDGGELRYYASTIPGGNMISWMLVAYKEDVAIRVFTDQFFDRNKVLDFERRRFTASKRLSPNRDEMKQKGF